MVTGAVPFPPRFLPSIFIAHRVQQSHCSSIFHRVLLTHALAFAASQFVHKKKSLRIYTSMHSGGFELMKLTYTGLEDKLIRHRGDRVSTYYIVEAQKMHAQISYSSAIAQQRSTAGCRAVPYPALRCGAVPCCAALSFVHTAVPGMRSTRYQVPACTCGLVFCFLD